jgi:hypothetical protein
MEKESTSSLINASKGMLEMKSRKSQYLLFFVGCCWAELALAVPFGEPIKKGFEEVESLKPLAVGFFTLITIYGGLKWAFSEDRDQVARGKKIVMGAIFLGLGILLLQQVGAPITDGIKKFLDGGLLGVNK